MYARSGGLNRSIRDHRPTYGAFGICACMPTRCSIISAADSGARASRYCRARSARLSATRGMASGGCSTGACPLCLELTDSEMPWSGPIISAAGGAHISRTGDKPPCYIRSLKYHLYHRALAKRADPLGLRRDIISRPPREFVERLGGDD